MILMNLHSLLQEKSVHSLIIMALRGTSLVVKFSLTLFIARFMSFEDLGFYGLISAASIVAPGLLGLGLMLTVSRKAVTQTLEEITENLNYYRRFLLLIYTVILTISFLVGIALNQPFFTLIIALVIFFEHINNDLYSLLLNLSKPFTANLLHFIRTAAWMIVFMALSFVYPSLRTLEVLFSGWVCGGIITLFMFFWVTRDWPWKPSRSSSSPPPITLISWVTSEFRQARLVYINTLVNTASQYLNHFLVTLFLGLEMTGVYVYFMQIVTALSNLINTGILQLARPQLVRAYKENDPAYRSIYLSCMKNTTITALLMAGVAGPIMYFITVYVVDKPLAIEWFSVFWCILLIFVLAMIIQVNTLAFYSQHRDNLILKFGLVGFAGGGFNIILIPWLNLWGAVLAPVFICSIVLVWQYKHIKKWV